MRYTTPTRAPRVESASSNQGVLGQAQRKKTLSPGLPKSWMEPFLGRESHVLGGGGGGGGGGQGEEFNEEEEEEEEDKERSLIKDLKRHAEEAQRSLLERYQSVLLERTGGRACTTPLE